MGHPGSKSHESVTPGDPRTEPRGGSWEDSRPAGMRGSPLWELGALWFLWAVVLGLASLARGRCDEGTSPGQVRPGQGGWPPNSEAAESRLRSGPWNLPHCVPRVPSTHLFSGQTESSR